jgi:hypothetical protein
MVTFQKSTRKNKKLMATFSDGTITHFGDDRYEDYTIHKDKERRKNYLARHRNEDWNDYKSAGSLSRYILWGASTNLQNNIAEYKNKFNL